MNNIVLEDKIMAFVENRIQLLESGEKADPYLIVHYIPLSTFENKLTIDTDKLRQTIELSKIPMLYTESGLQDPIPNYEGILVYSGNSPDSCRNCTQNFRNGSIEARKKIDNNTKKISPKSIENYLKNIYSMSQIFFEERNINAPIFVFINFINITGYSLDIPDPFKEKSFKSYNQCRLNLQNIVIKNFNSSFEMNFELTLKIFYNAFGEYRPQK